MPRNHFQLHIIISVGENLSLILASWLGYKCGDSKGFEQLDFILNEVHGCNEKLSKFNFFTSTHNSDLLYDKQLARPVYDFSNNMHCENLLWLIFWLLFFHWVSWNF